MTKLDFPATLTASPETRAGRMLAQGRIRITVKSFKTGEHITVAFKCIADNRDRQYSDTNKNWVPCPLKHATHVFIEVPTPDEGFADKIGTFYPKTGRFYADARADLARVFAAKMCAHWLNGAQFKSSIVEESRCGACSRPLTDPESIARGIGPECFGKMTDSQHQRKFDLSTQAGRSAALDAGYEPTLKDFCRDQGTTVEETLRQSAREQDRVAQLFDDEGREEQR